MCVDVRRWENRGNVGNSRGHSNQERLFQNPVVEVGQELRSDPSCPPVSMVEVCRPTSTVDIQRSCAYFRVQRSETWENLLLLELTPEMQPQVTPHVVTLAWRGWGWRDGTPQQDDDGRTGMTPCSCSLGQRNSRRDGESWQSMAQAKQGLAP